MRRTTNSKNHYCLFVVFWDNAVRIGARMSDAPSSQDDTNKTGNSLPSGYFVITLAVHYLE